MVTVIVCMAVLSPVKHDFLHSDCVIVCLSVLPVTVKANLVCLVCTCQVRLCLKSTWYKMQGKKLNMDENLTGTRSSVMSVSTGPHSPHPCPPGWIALSPALCGVCECMCVCVCVCRHMCVCVCVCSFIRV